MTVNHLSMSESVPRVPWEFSQLVQAVQVLKASHRRDKSPGG